MGCKREHTIPEVRLDKDQKTPIEKGRRCLPRSERLHRGLITAMSRVVRLKIFDGFAMEVA